uniref:Chitinase 4 n=1 Tax=Phenacoccus solenopsis TaxID=483260 RepID=A0A4Y5SWE3_9HEMI|nr:chitinase 4 [Phenacoccus solenopsis]
MKTVLIPIVLWTLLAHKGADGISGNSTSSIRSSVERVHHIAVAYQQANNSAARNFIVDSELFSLPLRSSVEKVLTSRERAEENFPLREAVEKIPPLNNLLEDFKSQRIYKQQETKDKEYKVVCYLASWSWYRKSVTKFTPDYVDPHLCTHIVYAFAALDPGNYTIMASDPVTDFDNEFYKKITSNEIKDKAKVLVSIGGWTDSTGDKYSKLVSNGGNRKRFVNSVIAFLRRHNFQGLHVDWNYPVCWQARCSEAHTSDRNNFVKLIQELRREFDKQNANYELAVAVSGYKEIIDVGYDILNLNEHVDFLSVMTYDYHGGWENRTGHLSPLYMQPNDQFPEYNTDSTLSSLVLLGAEPSKLIMGVPFFGQSFTLADPNRHDIGDDAIEPGEPSKITQQPGVLSYAEICTRIKKEGWQVKRNPASQTEPYAFKNNQWVGFDDKASLKKKVEYMKKSGFGGIMTWTIDMDDFNNDCCTGIYPLLTEINVALGRIPYSTDTTNDCRKPTTTTAAPSPITTTVSGEDLTTIQSGVESTSTTWTSTTTTTPVPSTTHSTRPWWPPTLTSRPATSHRPRPPSSTTSISVTSTAPTKWTTKKRKTTKIPYTTASMTSASTTTTTTTTTTTEGTAEETTPHETQQCVPGKYYPDSTDCSSYYRCVYGKKKKEHCAPGLHWSPKSENCDWPVKANCREHLVSASPVWTEPTVSVTTSSGVTSTVANVPSSTVSIRLRHHSAKNQTLTTKGNRPAVSCISGEHYAVAGDCSSFYVCDGGRLNKRKCPNGLLWNKQKRLCDWTYNVRCNQDIVEEQNPDTFRDEESTSSKNGCNAGQYIRHLDNCNKYYECLWGEYHETQCPPGLFWNKQTMNCDWPGNVDCESSEGNGIEVPIATFIPPFTSTESSITSTSTQSPNAESTTTSTNTKKTTKSPWWTWTETTWSWSEKPSTSWEWTPSTTTATTLATPLPNYPLTGKYKVICYFTNWAWYRTGMGKYLPENIDPNLCTHVIYGFAVLDYEGLTIKVFDSWADIDNRFYERVAGMKKRGVKVSIAIGGWNDSSGDKYSRMVNSESARRAFISSVLRFLKQYGFDGLDLDWEYPKCWQVNCDRGPDSDKAGFAALVTELRQAFNAHGYLLSAAVSPSKTVIDKGYDVVTLSEKLDWIGVMTYDYHGSWDKKTGHLAPIYYIPGDDYDYFNLNFTINYWIEKGADRRKLIMGIPLYGQTFSLADANKHDLNAPSYGPGQAGEYTRAGGFLAYYEICDKLRREAYTIVRDVQKRRGPYAYSGNQWVGYDDIDTIKQKMGLVKQYGLGGAMIWALDLDDFRNTCGQGHYPLLNTIVEGLSNPNFVSGNEIGIHWTTEAISRPTTTTTEHPHHTHETSYIPSSTATSSVWTRPTKPSTETSSTDDGSSYEYSSTSVSTTSKTTTASSGGTIYGENNGQQDEFKVICYFTNWAWYRQGNGKYLINDIDANLCTHIIYAFAVLDSNKLLIKPHDTWADLDNRFYEKVVALKNRGIKVLLAIGGWNDSAGNKYSRLVNSKQARDKFISHVVQFLKKYNFDGLDVDWEYPKCWQVNCKLGPSSDKKAFADFITELREAFNPHGFLLSAAVSPNKKVIDEGYDVPLLSNKLDWISVMCYDYHGQWDEVTGHVAPMYEHPDDADKTFNANFSIHYWVDKGADRKKIVMGMPMYGQSFTLATPKNNTLNSKAYGGGEAGESTRARGFLAYYEICDRILRKGWEVEYDIEGRMGPYAKRGNQWVGFDDQAMIKHKSQYVFYNNLGGAMIWALDLDDFKGVCNCGSYPLLKTINKVLRKFTDEIPECRLESNSRVDMKLFYQNEGIELLGEEWRFESCEHGQVRKHPTDCSKYLVCSFGSYKQEQSCANGLHFNEERNMCDWPQNANCKPSIMEYAENYFLGNLQSQNQALALRTNKTDSKYKVICYLTNWSAYRYNNQLFPLQALDSHMCTHLVYGFAVLNPKTLTIGSNDTFTKLDREFFKRVRVLKETGVKILLAMGGWYDSMDDKYSKMVNSNSARLHFVKHAVKFLKENDFDGLEIDWEYPKCWQVDCDKGPDSDKNGFTALLRDLREAFSKHNLLLSAAVSSNKDIIERAYDIPTISSYVDWLSLMAYDYHGYWEGKANHLAPLYEENHNTPDHLNIEFSVSHWLQKGAPRHKLILGLPFYGQSFTLKSPSSHEVGSKIIGAGKPARHTRVPGFVAYYEICEMVSQNNWNVVKEKNGHYTYSQDQWISYNDVTDIRAKGKYIKENDLGGASVWALDLDDFVNVCGCGANPLLSAINEELSTFGYKHEYGDKDCI